MPTVLGMQLFLGTCNEDEHTISKKPTLSPTARVCSPYEEVTFNDELALVTSYQAGDENYNYAKVVSHSVADAGGTKYYYIRNRIMAPGGKIIFLLECDVLYTYKDDIYTTPCVCRRTGMYETGNMVDTYIYDANLPVRAYKSTDVMAADWIFTNVPGTKYTDWSLDSTHAIIMTTG